MLALLALGAAPALACGGFFAAEPVFSDAQQAIFEVDGDSVVVEYLVSYTGDVDDFGWVVPIPGTFESLDEGDPGRFADLQELTDPEVTFHSARVWCGCAATKGDNGLRGGDSAGDTGVTVVDSGTAGIFEFTALDASSTAALLGWLDTHGFDVGPSGPALDAYVAQGGFQFVAVELNELPTDTGALRGAPGASATIRYAGGSMVYPAVMSRYSTAPEQRTTLYVLGDQRATLSGWAVAEVGAVLGDLSQSGGELYEERLRELGGATAGYGLVYAGVGSGAQWVTRFDTIAQSAVHDADVTLALDGGQDAVATTIDLYENEREQQRAERRAGRASLLVFPLLGLGWVRRRRTG